MIINVLQELGLAKNEARIYETLLREGESGVSTISVKAEINRRNVYDSINRLIEKGLIYEIRSLKENSYRAVDPQKLNEILSEKRQKLDTVFDEMNSLYKGKSHKEEVFIYRGIEGWKNYLRDVLRVGENVHTIGGTGALADEKLALFMEVFLKEAKAKNITFQALIAPDANIKDWSEDIPGLRARLLPEYCKPGVAIDIFGDHIVILPDLTIGGFDEKSSITVIVNQSIANAFRVWFSFMWEHAGVIEKKKK
jgi:predicted transcriptional regulator